jgi:hypothetical protein
VNDKLAAHDAVRLRVSAALKPSGFPEQLHLLLEAVDDRVKVGLFIGNRLFFRDLLAFVGASPVDHGGDQPRERIAQHGIERRAEKGIKAALQVHEEGRCIRQPVQSRTPSRYWLSVAGD